jgi:sucrose-6F-phosphate phosphohydrolase
MTQPQNDSWCFVTDIDGTLIGESDSTLALRDALRAARRNLSAKGARLYCAIATGRTLESTHEVLLESGFELHEFDAFVTCVGAEVHFHGEPVSCQHYQQRLALSGFEAEQVRQRMAALTTPRLQPEDEQRHFKVSYHLPDTPEHRRQVQRALHGLPFETQTVFSHDNYLDIAPHNGAKGGAVEHLLARWNIHPTRAVAAGDSGNDLSMLRREWHSIVVANGHAALSELRGHHTAYFAAKKHAAGILEGLRNLSFL